MLVPVASRLGGRIADRAPWLREIADAYGDVVDVEGVLRDLDARAVPLPPFPEPRPQNPLGATDLTDTAP